jgi:hypothetical protein
MPKGTLIALAILAIVYLFCVRLISMNSMEASYGSQESKGNIKFEDFTLISRFPTESKNQFYLALIYSLSLLGSVEASHAMQGEVRYSFVRQLSVRS